jgi:hypothetical protein
MCQELYAIIRERKRAEKVAKKVAKKWPKTMSFETETWMRIVSGTCFATHGAQEAASASAACRRRRLPPARAQPRQHLQSRMREIMRAMLQKVAGIASQCASVA